MHQFLFPIVSIFLLRAIIIAQDCETEGCPPEMYCEDSSCDCKELAELYGHYDGYLRRCRLVPGLPCESDKDNPNYIPCAAGASCVNGICICYPGSRGAMDGRCKSDYGQPCEVEGSTSNYTLLECNNEGYLHCVADTCVCQSGDYMIWDTEKFKCVSKPGLPCGFNRIYQDNFLIECPTGYECVEDLELKFKKCVQIKIVVK